MSTRGTLRFDFYGTTLSRGKHMPVMIDPVDAARFCEDPEYRDGVVRVLEDAMGIQLKEGGG